jgi:uncharacterized protein
MRNKLVFLLPALLALDHFLPQAITPLLMLGGAYLCFEGAEKLVHAFAPHANPAVEADFDIKDPLHLEEEKVAGAIKTDFILSAEIMTIALATIESPSFWLQATTLAVVGIFITIAVYGAVALIVKMDDVGLHLAATGRTSGGRALGRGLVKAMPKLMALLSTVGTAAMLWVGGSIVLHGLEVTHLWAWPYETIHHLAETVAHAIPVAQGFVAWMVTATLDGIFGLLLGVALIPLATRVIGPLVASMTGKKAKAH